MKRLLIVGVFAIMFLTQGFTAQSPAPTTHQSPPAGSPPSQTPSPSPAAEKTAGEALKNVQVLKDVAMSDWTPTMQFISGSLSVTCAYCHQGPFESDAKQTKQTARLMIKMTRAINEVNFGGRQEVTCNTCHRGSTRAVGTPSPWNKTPEQLSQYKKELQATAPPNTSAPPNSAGTAAHPAPEFPSAESAPPLPDVDQVFANYRNAVGTTPVKTIHMSGTSAPALSINPITVEASAMYPDRFLMHFSIAGREFQQVMNGDHGWAISPQGRTDFSPSQMAAFKANAEILQPVKYAHSDAPRKVARIEKIGDRAFYVVESRTSKKSERLYFDTQSGLLYKIHAESQTPLGTMATETIFEDYRDVSGVKFPYSITSSFMEDRVEYKFSEIQTNISLDAAKFEPPPPQPPPPAPK